MNAKKHARKTPEGVIREFGRSLNRLVSDAKERLEDLYEFNALGEAAACLAVSGVLRGCVDWVDDLAKEAVRATVRWGEVRKNAQKVNHKQ